VVARPDNLGFDPIEMLHASQEGVVALDDEGRVLFANRALGGFLEVDEGTMIGRPIGDFLPSVELPLLQRLHSQSIENPSERFVIEPVQPQKGIISLEVYCQRPSGEGKPTYFFLRDITLRVEAEKELRQRNSLLDGLIESSVDGIIASDMKGNIILFNPGAQNLLGYSEQDAFESLHTTGLYTAGTAHEIMRKMRSDDYGGKGKCLKHRVIGRSKQGEEMPISLSGGIIHDREGREVASFGIFTDLRQVEQMQTRLNEKHLELVQSEKLASLGRLAAGVAHEINNPLSGVLIYANLVLEDLDEQSTFKSDMERIVSETTRCKNIVRELLDFARQEDGACEIADLNQIIHDGLQLLGNQAVFYNVEIELDLQKNLPQVVASAPRMSQVFLNLFLNAAEAMEGTGSLTITTRYIEKDDKVRVSVGDTGVGIDPENQNKIFEPFFTTKEVGKGTGLGLSVSYRILRDCGGTIEVESEPGQGATFVIEFSTIGVSNPDSPQETE
jgi:two-component system, NtrC family, sensor kinase